MIKKHIGPKSIKCWSYYTPVGQGWEVGFHFRGERLFVGNFLHKTEALKWYRLMNSDITKFSKRYPMGPKFPVSFFKKFISNHLYTLYYGFLDSLLPRHEKLFKKAFTRDLKKYSTLKKEWTPHEKAPFTRISA